MKNIYIGVILLSFVGFIQAQNFNKTSKWNEIITDRWNNSILGINQYEVNGDTTLNGEKYFKVFENSLLYAGLREDSLSRLYMTLFDGKEETILYDFGLKDGDSSYIHSLDYGVVFSHIIVKDSIKLLDGKFYEWFENGYINDEIPIMIIDGLGSTAGFFDYVYLLATGTTPLVNLLSFYINGQKVYQNPQYNFSDSATLGALKVHSIDTEDYELTSIKNGFEITLKPIIDKSNFLIFNLKGRIIRNVDVTSKTHIVIEGLPQGVYLYSILSQGHQAVSGKILIK